MGFGFLKKIKDGIVRAGKDLVGKITIVVKKMQQDVPNHRMKVENREPFKGFVKSGGIREPKLKNHTTT